MVIGKRRKDTKSKYMNACGDVLLLIIGLRANDKLKGQSILMTFPILQFHTTAKVQKFNLVDRLAFFL